MATASYNSIREASSISINSGKDFDDAETLKQVKIWRIKNLIRKLDACKGNGTSMISLLISPGREQLIRMSKMLTEEAGTAQHIKSRVNRQSVQSAICAAQHKLKLYNRSPENGLVVFSGHVETEEKKTKKMTIDFEPIKPLAYSLYHFDSKFLTKPLHEMLEDDNMFGFIVIDGNGALFGRVCGNSREVLHRFTVDLPKKHARGGQSAARFGRIRLERRHNYLHKVAETATQLFITDNRVAVTGIVLAGSADFKTELSRSDLLDQRLRSIILSIVDISYGGIQGFNEAIDLAADEMGNVKLVEEKKLINAYFAEISQDTGQYIFGVDDTLRALEMGAVQKLIVWENLDVIRYTLRDHAKDETKIVCLEPHREDIQQHCRNDIGVECEVAESCTLVEWLADNYTLYGTNLTLVSDRSQEGTQFVKGFGGIGGLLRYKVDFQSWENPDQENDIDLEEYFDN